MRVSDWSSDGCSSDLDLSDGAALRGAWERMSATLGDVMMPALVQSMLDPGVDVAITVKDHPQVGPVLTISPGGTATAFEPGDEVRVLPLGHLAVRRLVASARFPAFLEPDAPTAPAPAPARGP